MDRVELLNIKDHFQIEGFGTIVLPWFPVPEGWRDLSETVAVITPDDHEFEMTARFCLSHLNISDPHAPIENRYQVSVQFQGRTKDELPIGSRIFVSGKLRDLLLPKNACSDPERA